MLKLILFMPEQIDPGFEPTLMSPSHEHDGAGFEAYFLEKLPPNKEYDWLGGTAAERLAFLKKAGENARSLRRRLSSI